MIHAFYKGDVPPDNSREIFILHRLAQRCILRCPDADREQRYVWCRC